MEAQCTHTNKYSYNNKKKKKTEKNENRVRKNRMEKLKRVKGKLCNKLYRHLKRWGRKKSGLNSILPSHRAKVIIYYWMEGKWFNILLYRGI